MTATRLDVVGERMLNQRLRDAPMATVPDLVRHLGAVQAQDYLGAAWAVAQRTSGVTMADVDRALAEGSIIRTHVLRPTWHLVAPEDLRWMLHLTAPRVRALAASGERESGLDTEVIARCEAVVAAALANGARLTRPELGDALRLAGIAIRDSLSLIRVTMRAELDGVICSGGLRGKQQTYALIDERVPATSPLDRDAALATLASRYFSSHGPATVKDFAWWSGLSVADATAGARTAIPALESTTIGSATYWFAAGSHPRRAAAVDAHLLPNYDEYTVAYVDRSHVIDAADVPRLDSRDNSIFTNVVLLSGRVAGTWRRVTSRTGVRVHVRNLRPLSTGELAAIESSVHRFGQFLGLAPTLELHEAPVTR